MTLSGKELCIAFPDTVLEEHDSLREKTAKLGQIARICSIFGVDCIQVFADPRGGGESALIKRVLEYLETPQYLRKRLFPLDESLKYAGVLPPLRIPSHKPKVRPENLREGEFREGALLEGGRMVDIGLDVPLDLGSAAKELGRVTVRITSTSPLQGLAVSRTQPTEYWGYTVEEKNVEQVLSDSHFDLRVATSRLGEPLVSCIRRLEGMTSKSKSTMLLFGSPSRGLPEMIPDLRRRVDLIMNLYTEQHVATVRTEEAIGSALYLLEVLSVSKDTKV